MKRILASLAIVAIYATVGHAGKATSYNPSYGQPIRVVQTVPHGPYIDVRQSRSVFFDNSDGCVRLVLVTTQYIHTVNYSHGTVVNEGTVTTEIDRQVLLEMCS